MSKKQLQKYKNFINNCIFKNILIIFLITQKKQRFRRSRLHGLASGDDRIALAMQNVLFQVG